VASAFLQQQQQQQQQHRMRGELRKCWRLGSVIIVAVAWCHMQLEMNARRLTRTKGAAVEQLLVVDARYLARSGCCCRSTKNGCSMHLKKTCMCAASRCVCSVTCCSLPLQAYTKRQGVTCNESCAAAGHQGSLRLKGVLQHHNCACKLNWFLGQCSAYTHTLRPPAAAGDEESVLVRHQECARLQSGFREGESA
jgi:hypothetical protein